MVNKLKDKYFNKERGLPILAAIITFMLLVSIPMYLSLNLDIFSAVYGIIMGPIILGVHMITSLAFTDN